MAKESKITRIKATDTASGSSAKKATVSAPAAKPAKKSTTTKVVATTSKDKTPKAKKRSSGKKNVFSRIGGYFKGAWQELRVVRWPTRQATWALTLAVILFSAFFLLLILGLDAFFKYLFQFIIG